MNASRSGEIFMPLIDERKGIIMEKKNHKLTIILIVLTVIMLIATVLSLAYFRKLITDNQDIMEEFYTEYERQYVLITNDIDDTFWDSVYEEMKSVGELSGAYVERLGRNLSMDYSKSDLMEIAIDSHVDGIILEADESDETTKLIYRANSEGIPVVTLMSDCIGSTRKSYVGISNYNLGSEYGNLIKTATKEIRQRKSKEAEQGDQSPIEPVKVLILMDKNTIDTSQNIIYSAIQETLTKEGMDETQVTIQTVGISSDGAFSSEESIRDIFQNEEYQPNVIVCLNELNTTSVYQTIVDQNKVGQITIIGYYDSDTILRAVERNVIYATITVNTKQMGSYCVEALDEYLDTGYVSEYFSVDFTLIDANNIKSYIEDGEEHEGN